MSLTGLAPGDDLADIGFKTCAIVGNGRKARDDGNEGPRFATGRVA